MDTSRNLSEKGIHSFSKKTSEIGFLSNNSRESESKPKCKNH